VNVDPIVSLRAEHFGTPERLAQSVVHAEGGDDAVVKAVQCSMPGVTDFQQAIDVVCRSANHALWDFIVSTGQQEAFVQSWAKRWAPQGAANDPQNLNRFWPLNVLALWIHRDA